MILASLKSTVFSKKYWNQVYVLYCAEMIQCYGNSKLGKLWIVIKPILQVGFIGLIFNRVININQEYHMAYIMYNLLLFNFITVSLSSATGSIFSNVAIISKFNINKTIFPITSVMFYFSQFLMQIVACGIFVALVSGLPMHLNMVFGVFYLLYILVIIMITGALFAIIFPYLRDISFFIENAIMIGLWITPIFYPISQMPMWMQQISYFNPFFILITPFTTIMHSGQFPNLATHISMFVLLVILVGTYMMTRKYLAKNVIYYC